MFTTWQQVFFSATTYSVQMYDFQTITFIYSSLKRLLFMNYQRRNISQGYGFLSNARRNFFSGVLFPNCLLLWHSLLHNNVLHQIIQLFILLNAFVLFTDILNDYIITARYLFLHYLQCVFVNFCYRFHFFHFMSFHFIFVHRCFHIVFQRYFLSNFLKICSKVFSQGFQRCF